MVVRRVRTILETWDATSREQQERSFGRRKDNGAPIGRHDEHDPVPLDESGPSGPTIASNAHVRLAAPASNGGAAILRRGFNYADGTDRATGQLDAGLIFIAFQRDPHRQFVPIQRRLASSDALNKHLVHTGSALFAIPPGAAPGRVVGDRLFV